MLVPLLILFAGSAGLIPVFTSGIFQEIEKYERTVIHLDNAVIRLARRDRALLRMAERAREKLQALEHAHHAIHFCGRVPTPAVLKCRAADRAAEASLKALVVATKLSLRTALLKNQVLLTSDLTGISQVKVDRSKEEAFVFERCSICGLDTDLTIKAENLETYALTPEFDDSRVGVRYLKNGQGRWDYELFL